MDNPLRSLSAFDGCFPSPGSARLDRRLQPQPQEHTRCAGGFGIRAFSAICLASPHTPVHLFGRGRFDRLIPAATGTSVGGILIDLVLS